MNRRQKKKLEKRLGCQTYYGFRNALIRNFANRMIQKYEEDHGEGSAGNTMICIVDSKKMDLRHIKSLKVFFCCYPKAIGTPPYPEMDHCEMEDLVN